MKEVTLSLFLMIFNYSHQLVCLEDST